MMSNKGDNQERVQCPYDASHIIMKYRLQTHLVKCKRNFPQTEKVTCAYNNLHLVPKPELQYHLETCSDRIRLDKFAYIPQHVDVNKYPVVKAQENWDNEDCPTYNPEEHCKNNPILRNNIHTQPAAIRRRFRMEERARMQQFVNENDPQKNGEAHHAENVKAHHAKNVKPHHAENVRGNHRRPVVDSGGVEIPSSIDEDDPAYSLDILMEQIKLGARTVIVPPLNVPSSKTAKFNDGVNKPLEKATGGVPHSNTKTIAGITKKKCNKNDPRIFNDADYPSLGDLNMTTKSDDDAWSVIHMAMEGVNTTSGKPFRRGRGRGLTCKQN